MCVAREVLTDQQAETTRGTDRETEKTQLKRGNPGNHFDSDMYIAIDGVISLLGSPRIFTMHDKSIQCKNPGVAATEKRAHEEEMLKDRQDV